MSRLFRDVDGGPLCPQGSVVCIGAFDGLHLGHRALVRRAVARARERDVPAVALAHFFAKAGDRMVAQELLQKELRTQPASVPLTAMLKAAGEGQPLTLPPATAGKVGMNLSPASPPPAPGLCW